jgi:hypothetical protein
LSSHIIKLKLQGKKRENCVKNFFTFLIAAKHFQRRASFIIFSANVNSLKQNAEVPAKLDTFTDSFCKFSETQLKSLTDCLQAGSSSKSNR